MYWVYVFVYRVLSGLVWERSRLGPFCWWDCSFMIFSGCKFLHFNLRGYLDLLLTSSRLLRFDLHM